jgi:large subunit ribosomal protein L3
MVRDAVKRALPKEAPKPGKFRAVGEAPAAAEEAKSDATTETQNEGA